MATTAAALGAAAAVTGAGCAHCSEGDCNPNTDGAGLVVVGEVVGVDDELVTFELDDGQQLDVAVFGPRSRLLDGVRYRVPLFGSEDGPPTASLPSDCDCAGPFITRPDGDPADLREQPSVSLRLVAAGVLGGAAGVMLVWALVRWRRGEPL